MKSNALLIQPWLLLVALCIWLLLILAAISAGGDTPNSQLPGASANLSAAQARYTCEGDLIEVMFDWDAKIRLVSGQPVDHAGTATSGFQSVLGKLGAHQWSRICDVPEQKLDEIQERGQANTGQRVYNLNNILRLRIATGKDVWEVSKELETLPGVISARPVPRPTPSPWPPDYAPSQGYLDLSTANPSGIDAEYAWTKSGGDGTDVTVCDLEYGWYTSHQDVTKAVSAEVNPNPLSFPVGENDNHGTAVIGVMVSDANAVGTTGICFGAGLKTCGTYYGSPTPSWNVAGAIAYAMANMSAGDVILIEQQWDYSGTASGAYVPIEWWTNVAPYGQTYNAVYAAIVNATSNDFHVVEVGGNGNVNTDPPTMTWLGDTKAIIVGAGGAYTGGTYAEGNLQKMSFSSFGSRFDLQGWGENVVTTGYGDLYSNDGKTWWYTSIFAGTSSASPTVAGAVACLLGYYRHNVFNLMLTPDAVRAILVNTGTPQVTPPDGNIGPRPNLKQAISSVGGWVDVAVSTPVSDANWNGAWGDYDNDGDNDLYALRGSAASNRLIRNDNGSFTDVSVAPLNVQGSTSAKWGDYDNDGDPDLYVTRASVGNRLFHNNGNGSFTDVTSGPLGDMGQCTNVAWGDYDKDGKLDLYIVKDFGQANKLLRNTGGGLFVDATAPPINYAGSGTDASWVDYDNDGDVDLYVVNNNQANKLFRNDGGGVFTDVTGPIIGDTGPGFGAAWGDYDNDGDLDVYISNVDISTPTSKLLRNDGGGSFVNVTNPTVFNALSARGASWGDFDNDGDLDLFVASMGNWNKLFRNDANPPFGFTEVAPIVVADLAMNSFGAAWVDYNDDGKSDIFVGDIYPFGRLFKNDLPSGNHWLKVKLIGTVSNKDSYGARVRIVHATPTGTLRQVREIGNGTCSQSQSPLVVHFGVGIATTIDTLIAKWPSGITRVFTGQPVDTLLEFREADFVCGDANGDATVDISDVVYLIAYIFSGGSAPSPLLSGDANCDSTVDISDVVYLIAYIFSGGAKPCAVCK